MIKGFSFNLYRINIVDYDSLFLDNSFQPIRSDDDLINLIKRACNPAFDIEQKTRKSIFAWSLREFKEYAPTSGGRKLVSAILSRSIISKSSLIVTDDGIVSGTSASTPPPANTAIIFFDLERHLAAVEHNGELFQTSWRDFFEKIISRSAIGAESSSSISLEPVPEKNGIIGTFRSFEILTRFKITLRIPNPELNRYTKSLYEDLRESDIREYTQDMKNPRGISKNEASRPFASAAIAEQGYKDGEAHFEGIRDGKFEKVSSGAEAAQGNINSIRDFVRGIQSTSKTKEAQRALSEIMKEIDRIHPREQTNEESAS